MKISKVIITLIIVLFLLGVVSFFFPKDGITIGETHLSFPSLKEIFSPEEPQYADITSIIENQNIDTTQHPKAKVINQLNDSIVEIELPNNDITYLDKFFASLSEAKTNNQSVRIIHYGDSQIEGDRITSYIRTRLQNTFGGSGQGEIPLHSHSNVYNVTYSYSEDLNFYSIIDNKNYSFHRFGLAQNTVLTPSKDANIILRFYRPISTNLTLYCASRTAGADIKIYSRDSLLTSYTFADSNSLHAIPIPHNKPLKQLTIHTTSPIELYSLDLANSTGVYVDNVSLRGSSGLGFNRNNTQFLHQFADKLNVKLLLLQFGINAVPQDAEKVMTSYAYYKKGLIKQVKFLQNAFPDATIIMIGLSDRSIKKDNGYETNPNVKKILAVQKAVADSCGVAFWDLFTAMGGENSMPAWVLRDKPLANKDFIHFNSLGASYVGEMFYKALENAYYRYQQR